MALDLPYISVIVLFNRWNYLGLEFSAGTCEADMPLAKLIWLCIESLSFTFWSVL